MFADIASSTRLPPGSPLSPEIQARLWLERPCQLLDSMRQTHGDIFTLRLGSFGTMVFVADPEAAREVLYDTDDRLECSGFNNSYRYAMGDRALFLQDGVAHRDLKRAIGGGFRGAALADHPARILRLTAEVLSGAPGETLAVRPLTHEITLRALLGFVFGDDPAIEAEVLGWFRATVWRDMRSWKPWTALSRLEPKITALIAAGIAARRAAPAETPASLLDHMVAAHDAAGAPLPDETIRDQIRMLMITAGDATAVAASWALWRAAAHPEAQARLRPEFDPPEAALTGVWMGAFAQEVLRLHTVLPTVSGRRLPVARLFRGYEIGPDVTLAPCEYLIHRRSDLYAEPLAFRPERFLERSWGPGEYFPFGGGRRACMGAVIAPMTLKMIVAGVLARHRLSFGGPEPRVERLGTLLTPPWDLSLTIEEI